MYGVRSISTGTAAEFYDGIGTYRRTKYVQENIRWWLMRTNRQMTMTMTTTATRENCNIEFREFVCLRFWLEFRCAPYGKRRPNPKRLNSLCVLSSVGWCDTIIPHLSAHFVAFCEKWQKTKTTATKWKRRNRKKKTNEIPHQFFLLLLWIS